MPEWALQLSEVLARERCVLVTLNLIVGSAPRDAGCRMIVTSDEALGSIGGGNLEFEATASAREMLARDGSARQQHRPYVLGPALKQCCGGAVTLLFERYEAGDRDWLAALVEAAREQRDVVLASAIDRSEPARYLIGENGCTGGPVHSLPDEVVVRARELLGAAGGHGRIETVETPGETWWLEPIGAELRPLTLFGAGHVGQAVVRLLADLPFEVNWVDPRPDVFPERTGPNVNTVESNDALAEVGRAPPGSIFVVMTHSHQLDEDICFEVLSRGDFSWLGLIGSVTKRRRFVQRLARRGIGETDLARLVCPIGLRGIKGKQPATIALSLAAQLMHGAGTGAEMEGAADES